MLRKLYTIYEIVAMKPKFNLNDYRTPFVNSPFYDSLKNDKYHEEFSQYTDKLNEDGYVVIDLNISNELIDKANADIEAKVKKNEIKLNSNAYHYNKSPRIVEAWKFSNAIKEIVNNKKLLDVLEYCYQSKPIPFSTINFLNGTEQPLHSDEIHFGSIPHGYLTGCWIALEDIHKDSGPLAIAEKSHNLPLFSYECIGLGIPKSETEFKQHYTIYEEWVKKLIESKKLIIKEIPIKKGECIIWLSNTLHGAFEIKNKQLSRKSMAIHFNYEKSEKAFYPSYSNLEKGKYVYRSLDNINNQSN